MPEWLITYLNWWGSQVEKITEMALMDFIVSIPLSLLPLVLLYWLVGGFKSNKKKGRLPFLIVESETGLTVEQEREYEKNLAALHAKLPEE